MRDKKGLSPVVATVLLLLLTVSATVMIAAVVIPFVRDNLNKGTECVGYENYFSFEQNFDSGSEVKKYNCHDSDPGSLYGASVRAGGVEESDEIIGFELVFIDSSGGSSDKVSARTGSVLGLKMLDGSSDIVIPKIGEVRTYVYSSSNDYGRMEIAPYLKSGRTCPVSDSINIIPCTDVNLG